MWRDLLCRGIKALFSAVLLGPLTVGAQVFSYDFVWYTGAKQTWVYEAGQRITVDVYQDASLGDGVVLFRFKNGLDDPLIYNGAVLDHSLSIDAEQQFDTGTEDPGMITGVYIWEAYGDEKFQMN